MSTSLEARHQTTRFLHKSVSITTQLLALSNRICSITAGSRPTRPKGPVQPPKISILARILPMVHIVLSQCKPQPVDLGLQHCVLDQQLGDNTAQFLA